MRLEVNEWLLVTDNFQNTKTTKLNNVSVNVGVSVNHEFIQRIVTDATDALCALVGREKESFKAAS